ncbi:MAG: hypothetical protein ACE5EQ_03885 [Phycisphaerae bacterium]
MALLVIGCTRAQESVSIRPVFERPTTIAVAPILNFSGEFSLDPVKAADLLASELSYVEGVDVLPVNRVMAILAAQNQSQIVSPAHAIKVAEAAGAGAILVAGITEYDAYTPTVGIVLQMYTPSGESDVAFDPVVASRMAEQFAVTHMADPMLPSSQVQRVYNGAHRNVRNAVRRYARPRMNDDNPFGWRQYLKVQTRYLRFCWHDAITRLMNQERSVRMLYAVASNGENPE